MQCRWSGRDKKNEVSPTTPTTETAIPVLLIPKGLCTCVAFNPAVPDGSALGFMNLPPDCVVLVKVAKEVGLPSSAAAVGTSAN